MKRTDALSLKLPASADYLPVATFTAKQCAQGMCFPKTDIDRVCLAVEEAFAHALEFGYGGPQEQVHIDISRTSLGIQIAVSFHGLPLEITQLPKYDPSRALEHADVTGLNLLLIEKMLDTSSFSSAPGGIRTVTMERYLPAQLAADQEPASKKRVERSTAEQGLRAATPEDAETISRLAFKSHGDVLFSEHIYYPDRVREMIHHTEMSSVLIETKDTGEVVGHGALLKNAPGAQVEEMTFGFVLPAFRSRGGATAMAEFLEANAKSRGIYAIEVFAVTSHVHSQRSVLSNDFVETGLLLDTSPPSHSWGNNDADKQRIGNVVYVKHLGELSSSALHVPCQHLDMIGRIYELHGITPNFAEVIDTPPQLEAETDLWCTTDFVEGWTMICINEYGQDVLNQVSERLNHSCAQGITAIQMALPLENPATQVMTAAFEDMGFFFASVGPVYDNRERLILQYINLPQTDYDSIHVHSELAKEIKEYVRSLDPRFSNG